MQIIFDIANAMQIILHKAMQIILDKILDNAMQMILDNSMQILLDNAVQIISDNAMQLWWQCYVLELGRGYHYQLKTAWMSSSHNIIIQYTLQAGVSFYSSLQFPNC